jgi:hypothetical protein
MGGGVIPRVTESGMTVVVTGIAVAAISIAVAVNRGRDRPRWR